MSKCVFLFLFVCFFITCGCAGEDNFKPPRELTVQEKALAGSSRDFGFELFNEVLEQSDAGNVFISPLSVSFALGMAYNGAAGDTAEAMKQTLNFANLSKEEINEGYLGLMTLLTTMDPEVTLEIANSIWYAQNLSVLDEFIANCATYFMAVVQALDFSDSSAAATINNWVSDKTKGKITEIVENPIDPLIVMYLINAVYFKGDWTTKFKEESTADGDFYLENGDKKTVKMMHQTGHFPYLTDDTFSAVELPYGHELFAMTILLPSEGITVDEMTGEMNATKWEEISGQLQTRELSVSLPRFAMRFDSELSEVLKALGMEIAFDVTDADFSGISSSPDLFISKVKHKTYVLINEQGTEAAAATSGEVAPSAEPEPISIDHPFLLIIRDRHSQSLLFMGKVSDPPSA
jgi:serine protease inhibitor